MATQPTNLILSDGYHIAEAAAAINALATQANLNQLDKVEWRPISTDVTKNIFIADAAYLVTAIREVHGTASSSGTLQIEKLTGTTAAGSGTNMMTGTINLAATANTVVSGTLTATTATLTLAVGDRIGGVLGGTLTSLAGCSIVITLQRI